MKRIVLLFIILFLVACKKQSKVDVDFISDFKSEELLSDKYLLSSQIEPNILTADFNGDGKDDKVTIIQEKASQKIGLLFQHSDGSHYIVGAGKVFTDDGWDDMNWLGVFEIDRNKKQEEFIYSESNESEELFEIKEIKIPNIGVVIREEEGSGGLLYFNGKEYQYLHQGD
ncbi:hypothetical protein [Pseudofulvibacter geojedonensis]|uniref:VCBS repeat-containing protein n=1 Tax=Pseudofulvibacter geojedonensis TaxID=1123758 RepID=A0ABW3HZ05_9FLAO